MQYSKTGQLTIRPLCAAFHQDCKVAGRQDPYIEIDIGAERLSSCIATSQGIDPAWVDRIDYNLNGEKTFTMYAYDSRCRQRDDFNGYCIIDLKEPCEARNSVEWYDIFKGGNLSGKVKVAFEFIPDDSSTKKPDFRQGSTINGGLINSKKSGLNGSNTTFSSVL